MAATVPFLLSDKQSLDGVVSQVRYTALFLRAHPNGTAYRATWDALLDRAQKTQEQEAALQDALEQARVAVVVANALLDAFVETHRLTLRMLVRDDLTAPLYQRYYGAPTAWEVRRMSLGPQVQHMTPFVASMKTAKEKELSALAKVLEALLSRGTDALSALSEAQQKRDDFASRERPQLVDAVNGERRALFGELSKWAAGDAALEGIEEAAFRRRTSQVRGVEATVQALQERLASAKEEVAEAEAALAQAQAEVQAAQQAEEKRKQAEAELAALEAQKQELARKEEALKAQLKDKGKGPAMGRGKGKK